MKRKWNTLILLLIVFSTTFCKPGTNRTENSVRVRLAQDPGSLNPLNYSNTNALQIINLLYQSLLTVDLADGKLKPGLAESLPTISRRDSLTYITYRLRQEATWSNGSPVTANDVILTLKAIRCPLVNNEKIQSYFEFIQDVQPDPADTRKFTLVCRGYTPEMQLMSGDFAILPEYLADPELRLRQYSLTQLSEHGEQLQQQPAVKAFADWFNSQRFTRDTAFLKGSGGYRLASWQTGKALVLHKKSNWWGDALSPDVSHITAKPEQITFSIIPDNTAALLALKSRQVDVVENIPATSFSQLTQDEQLKKEYQFFTPPTYEFVYFGINSRLDKFKDKRTRQALAYLADVASMIKVSQQNYAIPAIGPVHPEKKEYYNAAISPYTFNIAEAKRLLREAGWQEQHGGWQKVINGNAEKLSITLVYKAGNTVFENLALLYQEAAAKAGIPVTIQAQEGGLIGENLRNHRFELFIRSISGNPFVYNFKPFLHTEQANTGGSNVTGFGNALSDALIDKINTTENEAEKAAALRRLQQILHEEANLIFLYFTQNRIAVNKKFTKLKISGLKPGFDVSAFELKE